jgi:hypothetical protein
MAIKSKILESRCDIVCLQETKKEVFDIGFVLQHLIVLNLCHLTELQVAQLSLGKEVDSVDK